MSAGQEEGKSGMDGGKIENWRLIPGLCLEDTIN
jgi:hypothetical protein